MGSFVWWVWLGGMQMGCGYGWGFGACPYVGVSGGCDYGACPCVSGGWGFGACPCVWQVSVTGMSVCVVGVVTGISICACGGCGYAECPRLGLVMGVAGHSLPPPGGRVSGLGPGEDAEGGVRGAPQHGAEESAAQAACVRTHPRRWVPALSVSCPLASSALLPMLPLALPIPHLLPLLLLTLLIPQHLPHFSPCCY